MHILEVQIMQFLPDSDGVSPIQSKNVGWKMQNTFRIIFSIRRAILAYFQVMFEPGVNIVFIDFYVCISVRSDHLILQADDMQKESMKSFGMIQALFCNIHGLKSSLTSNMAFAKGRIGTIIRRLGDVNKVRFRFKSRPYMQTTLQLWIDQLNGVFENLNFIFS